MTASEKLAAAEAAYHDLMTGRAVRVFQDQNGERVEYTVANASRLLIYINDLKRQIGSGIPVGPMRVFL